MAKYNINQIQKMVDRLEAIGIKSEKAVLDMQFEILEDIPNFQRQSFCLCTKLNSVNIIQCIKFTRLD